MNVFLIDIGLVKLAQNIQIMKIYKNVQNVKIIIF